MAVNKIMDEKVKALKKLREDTADNIAEYTIKNDKGTFSSMLKTWAIEYDALTHAIEALDK